MGKQVVSSKEGNSSNESEQLQGTEHILKEQNKMPQTFNVSILQYVSN